MAVENTLSIIKPDAVAKNVVGQIYSCFEDAGLSVVAARMMHLSQEQAGEFYAVHGSDALDTAKQEIAFFFGADGVCPRTR